MCLVVQARKLKPGIIEILSHPTTHILVSGQGEILKANQPRVYEHIMEHVNKSLLNTFVLFPKIPKSSG